MLTDAREFFAAVTFARPVALWLLLLLPFLGVLNLWSARRRRTLLALIGRSVAVARQFTHSDERASRALRWLGLAYPLAWLLLVLGFAGPRWGLSDEPGVAVGRDLVIVIDLSRTMLADDMADPHDRTRWQAARAGALDLLKAVEQRGGHRVAVIVFAAHPKLLCPLTTDYEHVRAILEAIDAEYPPPEIRPGADPNITSGTRIGAALIAAVKAHDEQFPGSQDIVLISDGDDPGNDDEWVKGSDAARAANIPVDTVGVGDPAQPAFLTLGRGNMQELVSTQLQEVPLKRIAAETRGHYVSARREVPALGEFFRTRIEPTPSRVYTGNQILQPRERYPWFVGAAFLLFLIGWLRGR